MSPTPTQYWEAGNYAFSKEEYAVAARCFEAAIGGGLNAPSVWNNLAVSLGETDSLEKAGWAFRQALTLSQVPAFVWANYGRLLIRTEEWRSAASAFDKASRQEPDNLNYVVFEAYSWLKSGKPQAAISLLEPKLTPESELPQGKMILVESYLAAGERDRAFKWLKRAIKRPGNSEERIAFASLLIERQLPDEALAWLDEKSSDSRAVYLIILARIMKGEWETASGLLEKQASMLSELKILQLRSWIAMAKGDSAQALKEWKSLLELTPESPTSRWGYVQLLDEIGEESAMIEQLDILLTQVHHHAPGLWRKARYLQTHAKQSTTFRKVLDKVIQLRPVWPEPRIMRAYDEMNRGLAESASKDFGYLIRKGNQTHDVLMGAALCATELDQPEKSLGLFQQLSERYPTHPQSWWNLGMAAAAAGQWRISLEAMNQYLLLEPESSEALSLKAKALFKLGRTKEAGDIWRGEGSGKSD